jgi:hypothetical protein
MKISPTIAFFGLILFLSSGTIAQTTAFNFQGRLNDGTLPANGRYDLQFKLFPAITGGSQAGPMVDRPNLQLINGVFSTTLDFGSAVFLGDRFLEISVRPNGSPNAYVVLGARQQIMSVPFAVRAASAANADFATNAANAATASNADTASNSTNSAMLGNVPASGYTRLNLVNQGDVLASNLVAGGNVSGVDFAASGTVAVGGNARQSIGSGGFIKAMMAVTANGALARCYNGVTGSTSCVGFGVSCASTAGGNCIALFPFQVSDRFWIVVPDSSFLTADDQITASVGVGNATTLRISLWKNGSRSDLPFHLFVY